jgi:hypothetical protein
VSLNSSHNEPKLYYWVQLNLHSPNITQGNYRILIKQIDLPIISIRFHNYCMLVTSKMGTVAKGINHYSAYEEKSNYFA